MNTEVKSEQKLALKQELSSYIESNSDSKNAVKSKLSEVFEKMLANFDFDTFESKKEYYSSGEAAIAIESKIKYFDLITYLESKMRAVIRLGIDKSEPLSILDLGTGAGHFPFLCQQFAHRVIASDIPDGSKDGSFTASNTPENPNAIRSFGELDQVYSDLISLFEIDWRALRVQPLTPLPDFGTKFDLITAFMINFNKYRLEKTMWGLEEWIFLFRDILENQLSKNGRLYFQLNRAPNTPGLQHDDPAFIAALKEIDSRFEIHDATVTFGSF